MSTLEKASTSNAAQVLSNHIDADRDSKVDQIDANFVQKYDQLKAEIKKGEQTIDFKTIGQSNIYTYSDAQKRIVTIPDHAI